MEKTLHLLEIGGAAKRTENSVPFAFGQGINVEINRIAEGALPSAHLTHFKLALIRHDQGEITTDRVLKILRALSGRIPCAVAVSAINRDSLTFLKEGAVDCFAPTDHAAFAALAAQLLANKTSHASARLAQTIAENDDKFTEAFFTAPDAIAISRVEDGVYLDINQGFTRLIGYAPEEVIGRSATVADLGIWVRQSERERMLTLLMKDGYVEGFETSFRKKNGQIITALSSGRCLKLNGVDCLISFTRDITRRKNLENAQLATLRLLDICNQSRTTESLCRDAVKFFTQFSECSTAQILLADSSETGQTAARACWDASVVGEDAAAPRNLTSVCSYFLPRPETTPAACHTPRGSFSTASLSAELNHLPPPISAFLSANPQALGACESLVVIPLRSAQETFGFLLIQDPQKNHPLADKIEFLETLADYVAVALGKLKTEKALRANEEHLRQMLESAEAGYFYVDASFSILQVNGAWLRLHGYKSFEDVAGRPYNVVLQESDYDFVREAFAKTLSGVKVASFEIARKREDGSIGYNTVSTHLVREGARIAGLEGFIIDTTSLRIVREQYQMLFEQMLDGFILQEVVRDDTGKAVDCRFIDANPAFETIAGAKAADIIGRNLTELIPGTDGKWIADCGEVERTGTPLRFEGFVPVFNKHVEILAFRPKCGQVASVIRDLTARKQLELQLLHSQKMDAVGQLAGGVAHDFNNFLAAIMIHLNLLQRTPGMNAEILNSLRELETEAKRAADLTRQLLMFSHRQVMQLTPTDLNDLLKNLLKMLRRLIGEHIRLSYTANESPLWIDADPGMIDQVIMNLCVNARDAMPQGGLLKIEAAPVVLEPSEPFPEPEHKPGNYICLTVTDNGCGMSPEIQRHIFEPFFTTKESGKGTGLGLATVYSIVKQHHGWVVVTSQPDEGSVFRVYFPARRPPARREETDQPAQEIRGGGEGILVVEDDAAFRNMVVMSLKLLGYRVLESDNGRSALQVWNANSGSIDLVLTDLVMPDGISGVDLCRRLRASQPDLHVMITTGYSNDRINPKDLETEGIGFLPKPFTASILAEAVRNYLDRPIPTPSHG